jgi:uncharacterized membrane protein
MPYLVAYLAAGFVFLGLDALWLGRVAKAFYFRQLDGLIRESPDLWIAGLFYLGYIAGLVFLAVQPALQAQSWKVALSYGAVVGFVAYGTYDMTNLATLKGWPWAMSLVDLAWGTALTATAATAGYLAARAWG